MTLFKDNSGTGSIIGKCWGQRMKLPTRRKSITHSLTIGGQKLFLTIGHYDNEMTTVGEIFIQLDREGSILSTMCDSWCIAFSFALQWGVPLESLVNKFLWTRCEPCGEVTGHPDIVRAMSIQDLVAKILAIEYLGRRDIVSSSGPSALEALVDNDSDDSIDTVVDVMLPSKSKSKIPYTGSSDGSICKDCGSHRMKRTGTCLTCQDCGSNSGCS